MMSLKRSIDLFSTLVFLAGLITALAGYSRFQPLDPWNFFAVSLWQSVPLVLAFLAFVFRSTGLSGEDKRWPAAAAGGVIGMTLAVYGAQMIWNGALDRGESFVHEAKVVSKKKSSKAWMLEVGSWRGGHETESLNVARSVWRGVEQGKTVVRVTIRPGALEREWVASVAVAGPQPEADRAFAASPVSLAYQRNNVPRTPYDTVQSGIEDRLERDYVVRLLALCEEMMVARTQAMDALYRQGTASGEIAAYEAARQSLSVLPVPRELHDARDAILDAARDQQEFLTLWAQKGKAGWWPKWAEEPLVRRSSQRLIEAYGVLIALYPSEPEQNKKSFHDTLCALDFI